jgi:hypothetical protein
MTSTPKPDGATPRVGAGTSPPSPKALEWSPDGAAPRRQPHNKARAGGRPPAGRPRTWLCAEEDVARGCVVGKESR